MKNTLFFTILTLLTVILLSSTSCHLILEVKDDVYHCGNGILETGEECDGTDFGNFSCKTEGYGTGTLTCDSSCHINTSECYASTCGNGILEGEEECDGTDLGELTCESFGYASGYLVCGEDCLLDKSGCGNNICGDGVVDDNEDCDGTNLNNMTCESFNYTGGTLHCNSSCILDISECYTFTCGNGILETGEDCDGTDLDGFNCTDLGYSSGTLACSDDCTFSVENCSDTIIYLQNNFDTGDMQDWIFHGTWELGTPADGPGASFSDPNCIAVDLYDDYSKDLEYDTCNVVLPPIDLTSAVNPVMVFMSWMRTGSSLNGGRVEVSIDDGQTWEKVDNNYVTPHYSSLYEENWSGDLDSWNLYTVILENYTGQQIQIRFAFSSTSFASTDAGWYIDNVIIYEE